jgi:hypothetical protein
MQCAFLGGIAVAYLMPALAGALGGPATRAGYGWAAAVIGAIATGAFLYCFSSVREPPMARAAAVAAPAIFSDARGFLQVARRSEPLLRVLLAKFLITFTLTMHTRNIVYYVKYVLGAVDAVAYAMPLLTAASFPTRSSTTNGGSGAATRPRCSGSRRFRRRSPWGCRRQLRGFCSTAAVSWPTRNRGRRRWRRYA